MPRSTHASIPSRLAIGVTVLAFFAGALAIPALLKSSAWYRTHASGWSLHARVWVQPTVWFACIALGLCVLAIQRSRARPPIERPTLGIAVGRTRAIAGIVFAALSSAPMLALGLVSPRVPTGEDLVYATLQAGVAEELLFRAFAFGLLVQLARLRVWSAAISTGLVFGVVHLLLASVQRMPIADRAGWIALIAAGGVAYAWLYWRWRFNLWIVVVLHACMNLWWELFDLPANGLAPWATTGSRIAAVGIAIAGTEWLVGVARSGRSWAAGIIPP